MGGEFKLETVKKYQHEEYALEISKKKAIVFTRV